MKKGLAQKSLINCINKSRIIISIDSKEITALGYSTHLPRESSLNPPKRRRKKKPRPPFVFLHEDALAAATLCIILANIYLAHPLAVVRKTAACSRAALHLAVVPSDRPHDLVKGLLDVGVGLG